MPTSHSTHHTVNFTMYASHSKHLATKSHCIHHTAYITLPASRYKHHLAYVTIYTSHLKHHSANITFHKSHSKHCTANIKFQTSNCKHRTAHITLESVRLFSPPFPHHTLAQNCSKYSELYHTTVCIPHCVGLNGFLYHEPIA